jgi:hypothetical protein
LPSGETETGVWGFGKLTAGAAPASPSEVPNYLLPINFFIPLSAPLGSANVHLPSDSDFATFCSGSAAEPKASDGHLCVYIGGQSGAFLLQSITKPSGGIAGSGEEKGANVAGAIINVGAIAAEAWAVGTWAVTAP